MDEKIRVLVVDDHTVVRKGVCALLSSEKYGIDVVGEAANGSEAIEKADRLQPDVILLDLLMPGMGGLEAIPILHRQVPGARILVLTSYAEDEQVVEAIRAGALGYTMKDASPDELISTIHNVYLNRLSLPQDLALKVFLKDQQSETKPPASLLTERELDVLRLIGQGDSNKQIASRLSLGTTTVRSHVSHILKKLGLENRTQLAIYARENGLTE